MHAHRSSIAKVVAATVAVAAIPLGMAVTSGVPSAAPAPPTTVETTTLDAAAVGSPIAWIAIATGATSGVTLHTVAAPALATQRLKPATYCGVDQDVPAKRLITLSGSTGGSLSTGLASYASGSLGVKEKKSGTSCSQVNATKERLQVALGPVAATILGRPVVASSAYLDVELKQSARILATASRAGEPDVLFELQSGSTVGKPPLAGVAAGRVSTCTAGADSGPDSGIGDNCRWAISVPSWSGADDGVFFDTLTLKAVTGSFSLEGGADGLVQPAPPLSTPKASIIELVSPAYTDGVLTCNASSITLPGSGDAPEFTVDRLGNADGSTCVEVPYDINTGPAFAQFLKPLDEQPTAQFVWNATWDLDPPPAGSTPQTAGSTALPELYLDYEVESSPGVPVPETRLGYCPDWTGALDGDGDYVGYTTTQLAAFADQVPDAVLPGTQFACVISRTATSVDGTPGDILRVTDEVYVYGDARLRW